MVLVYAESVPFQSRVDVSVPEVILQGVASAENDAIVGERPFADGGMAPGADLRGWRVGRVELGGGMETVAQGAKPCVGQAEGYLPEVWNEAEVMADEGVVGGVYGAACETQGCPVVVGKS